MLFSILIGSAWIIIVSLYADYMLVDFQNLFPLFLFLYPAMKTLMMTALIVPEGQGS